MTHPLITTVVIVNTFFDLNMHAILFGHSCSSLLMRCRLHVGRLQVGHQRGHVTPEQPAAQ